MALAASGFFSDVARSQTEVEAEADAAAPDGVIVYDAAFFARFNAVTALEMIQQLPGFVFRNSDTNTRGYSGAAGNVLINRRRPAGKADSLENVLSRIPVRNVESVELVQSGASGYETGRDALVANVNIRADSSVTRTLNLTALVYDDGHFSPSMEFVRTSLGDDRSLTLSAEWRNDHHAWRGQETARDASGAVTRLRQFTDPWTFEEGSVSVTLEQNLSRWGDVRVQSRVRGFDFERHGVFANFAPDIGGALIEGATDLSRTRRWLEEFELSAVHEQNYGLAWRSEVAFLARSTAFNDASDVEDGASGERTNARMSRLTREVLGRFVLAKSFAAGGEMEFSLETALNSREQDQSVLVDDGSGPVALDLPGSSAKIEESRSEASVLYSTQVSPRLGLDGGVRYEWSTLSRTGGDDNERSFAFLKPELRARYDLTDRRQVRVNVFREVSQLNFRDFLSSINFTQGGQLNGGNPELSPSSLWRVDVAVEQRFSSGATFTLGVFHERISDVIDRAPVFSGQFDAPSNIGDARRRGLSLEASAPLDALGLTNARLDLSGALEMSEVVDPVTGATRGLSDAQDHTWSAEYRQSFPNQHLNFNLRLSRASDVETFRHNQIQIEPNITEAYAYIETTRYEGWALRLGLDYIFEEDDDRRFITFVGDRSSGSVLEELIREKRQGAFVNIQVRRTF